MANRVNKVFPKMDPSNRAKQFMPFDALKGFREALAEKERVIVAKKILSEEQNAELDRKLSQLHELDTVTVEYFQNGQYMNQTGVVTKIDNYNRCIIIEEVAILFDDIADLIS